MTKRIFVTGADGQLGAFIVQAFKDYDVKASTRKQLDITNTEAVHQTIKDFSPSIVVNCAAYNDVDGAENEPSIALEVNALALQSIARAVESCGATLVHYSTDFVFDGVTTHAYNEHDRVSPKSTYAASKLLGEWFALDAPRAFVLRVESLFGCHDNWTGRHGTLDKIATNLRKGHEVQVFTDRIVSPTYLVDVVAATRHLVENSVEPGLYHCVNSGYGTWYSVAEEVARVLGITPRLEAVTMDAVKTQAVRPKFCALSNQKLAKAGFSMPSWQDALERWLS